MAIRFLAFALPAILAWLAVRGLSPHFFRPAGFLGVGLWILQDAAIAIVAAFLVDRQTKRLLPLAYLLNVTLVFPDQAPSRFGLALRSGSLKNLQTKAASLKDIDDPNETATLAIELVTALSRHDRRTRGHTDRVRAYCDLIAEEMGLLEHDRNRLAWGAMLHDIGKLTVPAEVLNKKDKLTDAEWKLLQNHPAAGAEMLSGLEDWLGSWLGAATEHHERWDGNGYPNKLVGAEISLAGRITSVADAYDVITSKRSYKEPMTTSAARAELVRCAGTQFDPDVVRSFLSVSVGRRRNAGFLAWLFEVPSLAQISSGLSGAAVSTTAAGAAVVLSVGGGALAIDTPLAFVQETVVPTSSPSSAAGSDAVGETGASESDADSTPTDLVPTELIPVELIPFDPTTSTSSDDAVSDTQNPAQSTTLLTNPSSTTPSSTASSPTTTSQPGQPGQTSSSTSTSAAPFSTTSTPTPAPTTSAQATSSTTALVTTTTTAPTTTTQQASGPLVLYLTNPGSGNTSSSNPLSLSLQAPNAGSLPNFDTDHDSAPGRYLAKDGGGMGTNDSSKRQEWLWTVPATQPISGTVVVHLWVGEKDLNSGEDIGVMARLQVCTPSCTTVGTDSWSGSSVGGYQHVQLNLGSMSETLTADTTVRLKVVAYDQITEKDIVLAYDTSAQAARIDIS